MTADERCSFVEAVAEDAEHQRPLWFVSHWWGEAIVDFLSCIQHHQRIRELPDPSAYWVCAYANNQHELGTELGTDPMQSSFLRAMQSCDGVVLILDPLATPFSRVWCCFEEGVVALASRGLVSTDEFHVGRATLKGLASRDGQEGRRPSLLLDIATVDGELNPQLLTEGLTNKEKDMEKAHQFHFSCPSGWLAKSKREQSFPLELIGLGLQVDISHASASLEVDRTRILNSLAGATSQAELDQPPVEDHRNIRVVDQVLRSTFAVAGWRQALLKKIDVSDHGVLPLARALGGDIQRRHLDLSILKGAFKEQEQVDMLALAVGSLTSLVQLHLDLSNCTGLTSAAELGKSISGLIGLQELFLHFTSCGKLGSIAEIACGLGGQLKRLNLSLQFCRGLDNASADDLGLGLSRLSNLEDLNLCFDCCDTVTSLDGLGVGFSQLSRLKTLKLNISRLKHLGAIEGLARGVTGLESLHDLWVQASFNKALSSLSQFGKSLACLTQLQSMDLNFQYCHQISGVEDLGRSLQQLSVLKTLRLSFKECFALASVKELATAIPSLLELESFSVELNQCTLVDLADVAGLVRSTTSLPKLARCGFALFGCVQLGEDLVYYFGTEKREELLALLLAAEAKVKAKLHG